MNIWTLLESWKSYGTWRWRWYQLWLVHLEQLVKGQEDIEIRRKVGTIQTTALIRWNRIIIRVLETWEDLVSLNETFNYLIIESSKLAPQKVDLTKRGGQFKMNTVTIFLSILVGVSILFSLKLSKIKENDFTLKKAICRQRRWFSLSCKYTCWSKIKITYIYIYIVTFSIILIE